MTKRVQYAQSLPALSSAPAAETDRVVTFAQPDGLYVRLADGTIVGPLTGHFGDPVFIGAQAPNTDVDRYLWIDTGGMSPTLWVAS